MSLRKLLKLQLLLAAIASALCSSILSGIAATPCATPSFNAPRSFAAGDLPRGLVKGDFNGDGKADVATANGNTDDVSVLLNDGHGNFDSAAKYAAGGTRPSAIDAADFNGDNKPDLIVANSLSNNLSLLLNNGGGTFAAAVTFAAGGSGPTALVTNDFNGDGKADVAVANINSNRVSVLLGNGSGSLSAPTAFTVGSRPSFVIASDLNNDGKVDLIATNSSSNNVSILLGTGTGSFQTATNFAVGTFPSAVLAGDFNSDTKPDLAVTNLDSNNVSVLLGDGNGNFTAAAPLTTESEPFALKSADFNNDGKPDLAIANNNAGSLTVYLGAGGGAFNSPLTFGLGTGPLGLAVDDFDGDGKLDVIANCDTDNIVVLKGDGIGNFKSFISLHAGTGPSSLIADDFNRDGRPDLAVSNGSSNNVSILLANSAGGFNPAANYPTNNVAPLQVIAADFSLDGKDDLAVLSSISNNVSILLGDGVGGFSAPTIVSFGTVTPLSIAAGDFNGDNKPDIVAGTSNNLGTISVLPGNGNGTFGAAVVSGAPDTPGSMVAGDFNSDGKLDLVVTSSYPNSVSLTNTVSVLLGNGNASFAAPVSYTVGSQPLFVEAADFNHDNKLDLAVSNNLSHNVSILLGDGAGGFGAATNFPVSPNPYSIAIADYNGDGASDLAVLSAGSEGHASASVLLGDGTGSFSQPTDFSAGNSPQMLIARDLNGDGAADLAVANANGVALLLNACAGAVTTPTPAPSPLTGRVTDINGNGISDVTLTVSGAASGQTVSAQTDAQGNYSFNNSVGGDTLTPSKAGYVFSPSSVRAVSSAGITPITGTHNFIGGTTTYTISGKVIDGSGAGLSDVLLTVSGSLQSFAQTDANGNYTISSLFAGGTYSITPSKTGYVFNPFKATFNNLSANRSLTFVGTTHPYTISGQVKDAANNPLSNVAVTLSRAGGTETLVTFTNASGNYSFGNVAGEATYTVTPSKAGLLFNPPSATFNNPGGNQTANFTATAAPTVQFSQSGFSFSEADALGYAAITVTRTGDTSVPVTVDYATSDQSGMTPCQTNGNGVASERCDYATAVGTLRFAAGETVKTIQIPLINDAYVEPNERFTITIRNPQGTSLGTSTATVTIIDDDTQPATSNPINDQAFFIKQQYIDFLGRVAEPAGFDFWMKRMNNCPADQVCDRIDTSQRFFQSDEFQARGFYVYRLYDALLGRLPKYAEFVPDVARLNGFQTVAEQRQSKDAYLLDFINKQEFRNLYGQYLNSTGTAATNPAGFVDALCAQSGITPAARQTLISNLQIGARDPAHTVEDFILTSEMSDVGTKFYDRGFITMQYFGYLRRDPEQAGFDFWVGQLIGPNAPHKQDYRFMVGGFLQADEYGFRFAMISATH